MIEISTENDSKLGDQVVVRIHEPFDSMRNSIGTTERLTPAEAYELGNKLMTAAIEAGLEMPPVDPSAPHGNCYRCGDPLDIFGRCAATKH